MPQPIVECIANYSAARRPQVVEAIMQAITSTPGAHLLDRHSDLDHNRTVLTFCGDAAAIEEAAFRSIAKAAELINLDEHTGAHPRIGATDVVPFVPIQGVTMQDCVAIARRVGQRVGTELGIPVYLYEEAATRPERQNLENIRQGEYEGLKESIATDPKRLPDFGPAKIGPAGATVIGARQPLVAYNVYLTSDDLSVARKIAQAVRHSSGGLRYVKALGMLVEGRAQVSMNLTNYRSTPIARVVELIRREAARYGVSIHHSELIGLIPQQALIDAAVWHLQLDGFKTEQILEDKLAASAAPAPGEAEEKGKPQADAFLDALACGSATPGGGSAAAYAGAMAASLATMVARLTIGKKHYFEVEAQMTALVAQAEELHARLYVDVSRDAMAYTGVMEAYRLPKKTPEQVLARAAAIKQATLNAMAVPLEVAGLAVTTLGLLEQIIILGNINAISDGGSAAMLALASLGGAALNVRTNAKDLRGDEQVQAMLQELVELENQARQIEGNIRGALMARGGIEAS